MRQGKYEQELSGLLNEEKAIPKKLTGIKRRGRKVRSCQNSLRKAEARVERARRRCESLPKPWTSYASHGKNHDLYARQEVTDIRRELREKGFFEDSLRNAVASYNSRYTDREELRDRFRILPDLIESAKQLAAIEAKRKAAKKAKPEKNWRDQWQEVVDGLVVSSKTLRAYLKTFSHPVPFDEDTVQVDAENMTFTYRPAVNTFLKLHCFTWEQAERMRA